MKEFLTTSQVAEELGVSIRQVQALIKSGRLKARQFGRALIIDPRHIEAIRVRPVGRPRKKAS